MSGPQNPITSEIVETLKHQKEVNKVRYWNPALFERGSAKVRLFKLHGSVDWFEFRPNRGDWSRESIGIPLDRDFWHTRNAQGQMQ
jgi:hypothetical protein